MPPRLAEFFQSGEYSPNLVTLGVTINDLLGQWLWQSWLIGYDPQLQYI